MSLVPPGPSSSSSATRNGSTFGGGSGQVGAAAGAEIRSAGKKEKKLGHRRITTDGEVTYKKFETTQLIGSIQLGIQHSVGSLASVDSSRDLLMLVRRAFLHF